MEIYYDSHVFSSTRQAEFILLAIDAMKMVDDLHLFDFFWNT